MIQEQVHYSAGMSKSVEHPCKRQMEQTSPLHRSLMKSQSLGEYDPYPFPDQIKKMTGESYLQILRRLQHSQPVLAMPQKWSLSVAIDWRSG